MNEKYLGPERRQFVRLDYRVPLVYKVCDKRIIDKLLAGYASDISQSGILCKLNDKVDIDNILWLVFDRDTMDIFKAIERNSIIYQNGILGQVVRINDEKDGSYNVGLRFLTREEKNLSELNKIFEK